MSITTPAPRTCGLTVFRLHWWNRYDDNTELFYSYPAALASLARTVRADWDEVASWSHDVPRSPDDLSDAEAVLAYYSGDGGAGGRETPTAGELFGNGFEIDETPIAGPEPGEISLRLASWRVLDGNPDAGTPAVTYCLDADGLAVAVFPDADGHLTVLITQDEPLTGLPITVRLEDPFRPGGFEHTGRLP